MESARASGDRVPELSVVIVNWNGAAHLGACLASVCAPGREVVVVDNASTDASRAVVRDGFPEVVWIPSGGNLGFARAANLGLRRAAGRDVLFLNPDARANEPAIRASIDALAADPAVGLVSVAVRDEAGALTPTVEPFFSLASVLRRRSSARAGAPTGTAPVAVDWCHGAFLLGRRKDLLALGGFDEGFFLYAEDMDLCHRMHESGRTVVYLPWVSIVHRGNASGEVLLGDLRPAAIFASQLAFHRRVQGPVATLALRGAAACYFGARAVLGRLGGRGGGGVRYGALFRVALAGPHAGPLSRGAKESSGPTVRPSSLSDAAANAVRSAK